MEAVIYSESVFSFELKNDVLLASWDESLSAESMPFYESIKQLFQVVADYNVKKVYINTGKPIGTLTEEVMYLVENFITDTRVEKVAILESANFHWDNNLMQFLKYINSLLKLPFEVRLFGYQTQAFEWLGAGKV